VGGGTVGLSLAKILENMEIGHNVLHGQWDWMRDPKIHSTTWDWDMASPAKQWQHSHNELHHTYTNVFGRDNDLGYGLLRVDEDQKWELFHLGQPIWHLINAMFFEYGIAAYDLELRGNLQNWDELSDKDKEVFKANLHEMLSKIRKQAPKDYVLHPLVSGPASCRPCGQLHRQCRAQCVVQHGHHLRALPRRHRHLRDRLDRRARPAASGICGRCSAPAISPARSSRTS
jgi:hypothetical protein